jgi:tetratricopeptide (TPR) repeat protein
MRRCAIGLFAAALGVFLGTPAANAQSALSNCKYYTKVLQDFQTGLPYCEQCLKEEGDNPEARFLAGWCLAEAGKLPEAWEAFAPLLTEAENKDKNVRKYAKDAGARVDGYFSAFFNDGVKLLGEGDAKRARDEFEKSTQIDPRKAIAFVSLGYAEKQLGNLDAALAAYRKALALEPQNLDANKNFVVAATTKRDELSKATPPDSAAVAANRAELMKSLEVIVAGETADPLEAAIPLAQLGGLQLESGMTEAGLANLKKAADLDPANAAMLYNVGVELLNSGQHSAAANVFAMTADALKEPSNELWPDTMFNMALAHFNAGEYPKAVESVEKLIAVRPDQKDYYELLRQAANKMGDSAKAASAAKKYDELSKAGSK